MANSNNYNLCFLALVLFATNIVRSENDLFDQTQPKKLRKLKPII